MTATHTDCTDLLCNTQYLFLLLPLLKARRSFLMHLNGGVDKVERVLDALLAQVLLGAGLGVVVRAQVGRALRVPGVGGDGGGSLGSVDATQRTCKTRKEIFQKLHPPSSWHLYNMLQNMEYGESLHFPRANNVCTHI